MFQIKHQHFRQTDINNWWRDKHITQINITEVMLRKRHKEVYTALFHLYQVQELAKLICSKRRKDTKGGLWSMGNVFHLDLGCGK